MIIAQALVYGIILGTLYGLVTVGLALLFGVMRYLNLAHGSFIMIGAYLTYWMLTLWHVDPLISIPIVMLILALAGFLVYKLFFAGLGKMDEGQRLNSSMLITFGLIMIIDNSAIALWKTDIRTVKTFYTEKMFDLFGIKIPLSGLIVIGMTLIIIFALNLFLNRTYTGKSIRATAQDWEAANLLGVNINFVYLITCIIGVALAGIAGTGIAITFSISPDIGLPWVLTAMLVLVLVGLGNIKEVFLGGLILGMLEQIASVIIGGQFRGIISLTVFVLILMFRPQGLFKR